MLRTIAVLFCCLTTAGCVSEVMGNADPEPTKGWTRIEGPVAYDDGTLLRGTLTVNALGDRREATLTDTWRSRQLYIGPKRAAEAFSTAMVARTGCRPDGGIQSNDLGDLRMFLRC